MLFVVAAALMAVVAWMLVCLCRVKRAKTRAAAMEARAAAEARRRALEEKERAHEAWRGRCAAFAMPGGEVMIAIETRDDDDDGDDETIENGDDARARDAVTCVVTLARGGRRRRREDDGRRRQRLIRRRLALYTTVLSIQRFSTRFAATTAIHSLPRATPPRRAPRPL